MDAEKYKELVEELRIGTKLPVLNNLMQKAADAIEELLNEAAV